MALAPSTTCVDAASPAENNAQHAVIRVVPIFLVLASMLPAGCATGAAGQDESEPLYARLLVREGRSWRAYKDSFPSPAATGISADVPYSAPPVEPPLPEPDFDLIPKELPLEPPMP
jgi:hypothetical protein